MSLLLHLCEAAVHEQFRTRDVAAVVGGEKHHRPGDLVRCPRPAERRSGRKLLQCLIARAGGHHQLVQSGLRPAFCCHDGGVQNDRRAIRQERKCFLPSSFPMSLRLPGCSCFASGSRTTPRASRPYRRHRPEKSHHHGSPEPSDARSWAADSETAGVQIYLYVSTCISTAIHPGRW